ncbi:hypothetical protein DMN50_13855 [Priestia megaterium]|nr:hypothetical protein DMN50_13855 [Priestia megaterium]
MINLWKMTCFITLVITLGFGLNYLTEINNVFPVKQEDISSLINTLWQVHASIATTSIAILALIIGLNKEKKYGFKTLDFMLNINRSLFKFHEEIILSLLLLVFQYVFVALNALSGALFTFLIAVYFILRMFYCSIKITLFEDKVNEEIRHHIFSECVRSIELENIEIMEMEKSKNE